MKRLLIIFLFFSINASAEDEGYLKFLHHIGNAGKCHLWKDDASNMYFINLSRKPLTNHELSNITKYSLMVGTLEDIKAAAMFNSECQNAEDVITCEISPNEKPTIEPKGCGNSSLFISPVVCKSGRGPSFTVMVACTIKTGQKVDPTKCYRAELNGDGGETSQGQKVPGKPGEK